MATDSDHARLPVGLAAVGAAVTTALVVTVAGIELLELEFGALVALPMGALAGLLVLAAVAVTADGLSPPARRALFAYAAFGPTVLSTLAFAYVNIGGDLFGPELVGGLGLIVSVVVYVTLWARERERSR